jgi:hypothetical protein
MSGTKLGGLKARETNLKLHGPDFYKRIGAKGGRNGHTGGFAANHTLAKLAGAKGGRNGKRGPSKKKKVKVVSEEEAIQIEVKKKKNKSKFGWLFGKR